MTDDEIKRIGENLERETFAADDFLRGAVQPYLMGSPEKVYGMAIALQRLGLEVVMRMRPDDHNAWDEAIGSLDSLKKEIEGMRSSGYPEPSRAVELKLDDVLSPPAKA